MKWKSQFVEDLTRISVSVQKDIFEFNPKTYLLLRILAVCTLLSWYAIESSGHYQCDLQDCNVDTIVLLALKTQRTSKDAKTYLVPSLLF